MQYAVDLQAGAFDRAMEFVDGHGAFRTGGTSPKSVMFVVDMSGVWMDTVLRASACAWK